MDDGLACGNVSNDNIYAVLVCGLVTISLNLNLLALNLDGQGLGASQCGLDLLVVLQAGGPGGGSGNDVVLQELRVAREGGDRRAGAQQTVRGQSCTAWMWLYL